MPNLSNVVLTEYTFQYKNDVTIRGSTRVIPLLPIDIGALNRFFPNVRERVVNEIKVEREVKPQVNLSHPVTLTSENDWDRMDRTLEVMSVSDNQYNGMEWTELDLSGFVKVRKIKVGNDCFKNVKKVNICGLSELESVCIGSKAFGRDDNSKGGSFCLKNCPKLKSLKMGRYSFSDYTVIEIENADALEEIEIGDLHEGSYNFYSASLNLKSMVVATQSPLDLPQLKRLIFGDGSFGSCHHLVFESNTISVSS